MTRASKDQGAKARICVVGQLPPPYGGQALMVENLIAGRYDSAVLFHVKMNLSRSMAENRSFRLRKMISLVGVIIRIYWVRIWCRTTVIYYPPSSSGTLPLLRDAVVLLSVRWMFRMTVFHFHASGLGETLEGARGVWGRVLRLAYRRPDLAIRASASAPEDGRALGAVRNVVLPNGISDDLDEPIVDVLRRRRNGGNRILFVGVVSAGKGASDLVQAARLLSNAGTDFHVDFVGEFESVAYERQLRESAKMLGVENRITFWGVLSGPAKWARFKESSVFCFPTYFDSETAPLVMIEAMEFGLPVVATDWRGLPDLVDEGVTGFLVPPKDPDAIAARVLEILEEPELGYRMAFTSRERFLQHHTIQAFQRGADVAFRSLARNGRRSNELG